MKRFGNVGGARAPAEVQTGVDEWVAEWVAQPLTWRGHKADPLVVEEESAEPAQGTPKGKTAATAAGSPAKPPSKGQDRQAHTPCQLPPCGGWKGVPALEGGEFQR